MEVSLASIEGDRASTLGFESCQPGGFPVPATACAMPALPEGRPGLKTPAVKKMKKNFGF